MTGPGVVKRGKASLASFTNSNFAATCARAFDGRAADFTITLRGVGVTKTEQAARHFDRQIEFGSVLARSRMSRSPPMRRGGTTECSPAGLPGARPMVPQNGFSGTLLPGPKRAGARLCGSYFQMCKRGSVNW